MKLKKHKGFTLHEKIGYSILAVYAISALIFIVSFRKHLSCI